MKYSDIVRNKVKEVDGADSGIDADLLDGKEAADFVLNNSLDNSIDTNGYQTLVGGVIIQWGQTDVDSDSDATVTFPITFPNACLQGYSTWGSTSDQNDTIAPSAVFDLAVDTMKLHNGYGSDTITFRWFAIGY